MDRPALLIGSVLALATVVLVAMSLRREPPPSFPVTAASARDVGPVLDGPVRVTVDATHSDRWVRFDFSRGAVVPDSTGRDWDIAFRRFHIMTNGGPAFPGEAAVAELAETRFDAVATAPDTGWVETPPGRDSTNPAIARWYDYGFTSHLLEPKPRVYALRTADRRFVKLRFLSYYCPGATPGCLTFEYVYQGDGSKSFARAARAR